VVDEIPTPEALMTIRRIHRWTSAVFTATVVLTFIALAQKDPVVWVSYVPLLPLAVLMITGLYLFVLPWTRRRATVEPLDQ
jgi:ABC-type polysaccharide/polyol phosphate export permease